MIVYQEIILDCDWLISVQLIFNIPIKVQKFVITVQKYVITSDKIPVTKTDMKTKKHVGRNLRAIPNKIVCYFNEVKKVQNNLSKAIEKFFLLYTYFLTN